MRTPARHGAYWMYSHHKCRCDECRRWSRESRKALRHKLGQNLRYNDVRPPDAALGGHCFPHPTWATCPICAPSRYPPLPIKNLPRG